MGSSAGEKVMHNGFDILWAMTDEQFYRLYCSLSKSQKEKIQLFAAKLQENSVAPFEPIEEKTTDLKKSRITLPSVPLYFPDFDFAVAVSGDGMKPHLEEGDIVFVRRCDRLSDGEIGIFRYKGELLIKIFAGDSLKTLNPEYPDILITEPLEIIGKVVASAKPQEVLID